MPFRPSCLAFNVASQFSAVVKTFADKHNAFKLNRLALCATRKNKNLFQNIWGRTKRNLRDVDGKIKH